MNGALIEEALRLAIAQVLPVALAAGGAALLVGLLAHRFGLNDPTLVLLARAAAVLVVLAAGGQAWFSATAIWTDGLWDRIAAVGQGRPP
jgi:flagellar biosynthesis protein FliQ